MSVIEMFRLIRVSTTNFLQAITVLLVIMLGQNVLAQNISDPPDDGITPADWAYGVAPPSTDVDTVFDLPGSAGPFTYGQIRDAFAPADWYPNDHPTMPDIVANGRYPDVWACALCHYPNGKGRPENAGIAGLPKDYFIQQLRDFQNNMRKSAQPRKFNTSLMVTIAQGMTDQQIEEAAEYYGSMPWTPWVRVIETEEVPKSRFVVGMYVPIEGEEAGMEPLGMRIMETPENVERAEIMRDPRAGFIAYAPIGSVAKGQELVTNGGGKTIQCGICHGADLMGLGYVPGIAGRSPTYTVRQLHDIKQGSRRGTSTNLMQPVVSGLEVEDMINIAAYLASIDIGN
jgi:cytochrome c553|tara:strand:- start:390 stop:1418 length:1029 start_codon:yes stop_codon:yes gene_type:complete